MLSPGDALGGLPKSLRGELVEEYTKIVTNYRESRWEASELNGGRLCEVVYSILDGHVKGRYPASASKPRNFKGACEGLESQTAFPDSVRMTVPRVLVGLYDIRNRRGVGHVGGDVDANKMDAEYVLHSAQWVLAELVRIFHNVSISEATEVVAAIVERTTPMVWTINDIRRVLKPGLNLADATLLLMYSCSSPVSDSELASWLEQGKLTNYRRVLARLHSLRMVEYSGGTATISPVGIKKVEEEIL